jgi:hypothetical protein
MEVHTSGEQRVLDSLDHGHEAHLCAPAGQPCRPADPVEADDWGADRTVGAAFLSGLLTSGRFDDPKQPDRHRGLYLHGARIEGPLDLSWLSFRRPVRLRECAFTGPLTVEFATLAGLDLTGSHLPGLAATGLRLRGHLILDRITAAGTVSLQEVEFGTGGITGIVTINLREVEIGGSLSCEDARVNPSGGMAVDLEHARIGGDASLRELKAKGGTSLVGAAVGGQLQCRKAVFSNRGKVAIRAHSAQITGGAYLNQGFTARGEVLLRSAKLGGLDCTGGSFRNRRGDALSADGAQITGGAFLKEGFTAEGEVRLLGAKLSGLECGGGS